jgi:hypothetical protein
MCQLQTLSEIIVKGYISGIFCLIAIAGNLICAIVLSSRAMRGSPVNRILLALSIADLTFSWTNLIYQVLRTLIYHYCLSVMFTHRFYPFVAPYVFPLGVACELY